MRALLRRAERIRWPHIEVRDVVMILLVAASLLYAAHLANSTGHKFCAIVHTATAHRVPKPADPKANPSRQNAYVFYAEFVELGRQLGCG